MTQKLVSKDGFTARFEMTFNRDDPRNTYSVVLPNGRKYYGEFARKFAANGDDHDFWIGPFGVSDPWSVGYAEKVFSADEAEFIKQAVIALFMDKEARELTPDAKSYGAKFLGSIEFAEDWIRIAD